MKRILSWALTVVLTLGTVFSIPLTADAETGSFGECYWELNGTELTIWGGEIPDDRADRPWGYGITKVNIQSDVYHIGNNAFKNCDQLTTVTLHESVDSIGNGAFAECYSLREINFPSSLQIIGGYAFRNCTSLRTVELPDSVVIVGDAAFEGCTSLKKVVMGKNIYYIGPKCFSDCTALSQVFVSNANYFYESIDNVIYSKDRRTLVAYPAGRESSSYSVLNGTQYISPFSFYNAARLESVSLPDSILQVGQQAFHGTAFYKNSKNYTNGVLYSGKALVGVSRDVTKVEIRSGTKIIADYAFSNCDALKTAIIPKSVTGIPHGAFYGCDALENIYIPASINYIAAFAFYSCHNLSQVSFGGSLTEQEAILIEYPNQEIEGIIWNVNSCHDSPVHNYGAEVLIQEAGCEVNGVYEKTCLDCGFVTRRKTSVKGHSWGEWKISKAATCEGAGDRRRKCTKCDIVTSERIEPLGHKVKNVDVITEPNCLNEGSGSGKCERCGKSVTVNIAASGHKFGQWSTTLKPTCVKSGVKEKKCIICAATEKEVVAALGHDFKNPIVVKEPTISSAGLKKGDCKRCNAAAEEVIPCTYKDDKTGIIFESDEGVFAQNTILEIEEIKKTHEDYKTAENILESVSNGLTVYRITPTLNGEEAAVNGTVYVKFPLPEGYGSDSTVFNIGLDGIARQAIVSADSKTGTITAKLENLGLCVICNGFNTDGEKTETKSDGNIEKIILYVLIGAAVLVLVAIALVIIIITKRRLRK